MNFKDKQYYINKFKYYAGMLLTALLFDAFLLLMFVLHSIR